MKKLLLLCTFLIFAIGSYAQRSDQHSDTIRNQQYESHYWRTHKTLKTVGWVSLGTGIPTFLFGLIVGASGIESSDPKKAERTGTWIAATGATLTVSSIPCFIISSRYKKKAMSLSVGNQQIFAPMQYGFRSKVVPTIGLKFQLYPRP